MNKKTWCIDVQYMSGNTNVFLIQADTLHEAFLAFSNEFYIETIAGIRISEVKHYEGQEKGTCAAVS